mmetsp:Transcript_53251/g.169124  ORF Transcript_53251/g.169124 Transcript_53251/m.169124 type:complete len:593 (+) Transcript_53251:80-1858(+)
MAEPLGEFDVKNFRFVDQKTHWWLLTVGIIFAGYDAFGIGANDVANSFANVVASRAVNIRQAAVMAVISEFIGAVALGKHVTDTIRKKVIDVKLFYNQLDTLMLAMTCSSIGSSLFLNIATLNGMPVSTTHTTVGTIVGVGWGFGGQDAVVWKKSEDWSKGIQGIVISWFLSPALSGGLAATWFLVQKFAVLRFEDSYAKACMLFGFNVWSAFVIVCFFMIYKGLAEYSKEVQSWGEGAQVGLAFGIGFFFALIAQFVILPKLRATLDNESDAVEDIEATMKAIDEQAATKKAQMNEDKPKDDALSKVRHFFLETLDHDVIQEALEGDAATRDAHRHGEIYSDRTEAIYKTLNVMTSFFMGVAHGSNDVANSIGVLTTVVIIYQDGGASLNKKVDVPMWILVYGALMIDLGLVMKGHHIMRVLGNNLTKVSAVRGFSSDIGAMTGVLTATIKGWPVSTTHCITGATLAVGLCNKDNVKAINWKMVAWCLFSWVLTLPAAGMTAGLVFSFVANSPIRQNCKVPITLPILNTTDGSTYNLEGNTCGPLMYGYMWTPEFDRVLGNRNDACPLKGPWNDFGEDYRKSKVPCFNGSC